MQVSPRAVMNTCSVSVKICLSEQYLVHEREGNNPHKKINDGKNESTALKEEAAPDKKVALPFNL